MHPLVEHVHNKLRKTDKNVHRYTTLKGDIAKKYLFLLLWSLMITHIYINCTVKIKIPSGLRKNIDLFWLMISKSDDFEMCLNIWCTLLCTCICFFPSFLSEVGMNEREMHGQKHF